MKCMGYRTSLRDIIETASEALPGGEDRLDAIKVFASFIDEIEAAECRNEIYEALRDVYSSDFSYMFIPEEVEKLLHFDSAFTAEEHLRFVFLVDVSDEGFGDYPIMISDEDVWYE